MQEVVQQGRDACCHSDRDHQPLDDRGRPTVNDAPCIYRISTQALTHNVLITTVKSVNTDVITSTRGYCDCARLLASLSVYFTRHDSMTSKSPIFMQIWHRCSTSRPMPNVAIKF